jgi:hypothetical protein
MNKLRELLNDCSHGMDDRLDWWLISHTYEIAELIDAAQDLIDADEAEAKATQAARDATIHAMECRRVLCVALAKLKD